MKKAMALASAAMISVALLSGGAAAQGTPQRLCCTDRPLGGGDWTVHQEPVPDPEQPPCHSKPTKIAVITSRSSGTE